VRATRSDDAVVQRKRAKYERLSEIKQNNYRVQYAPISYITKKYQWKSNWDLIKYMWASGRTKTHDERR
jgi:hypothetical protein